MRILLLLIAFLTIGNNLFAQKLVVNETDKFSKKAIKETSWMYVATQWKSALTVQARKVDEHTYLNFKVGLNSVFRVDEGEIMHILLSNDETLAIRCTNGEVAYNKNGQWMAKSTYVLSASDIEKLKELSVAAIRVPIGSNEYTDFDIKDRHSFDIAKSLKLL